MTSGPDTPAGPGKRKAKRTGRIKGTKNRATIEREAEAMRTAELAAQTGKMPKEILLELAREFWEKREAIAPGKPEHDLPKYLELSDKCADYANKAAPFYHPRLASVAVKNADLDLSRLSDNELASLQNILRAASTTRPGAGGERTETTRH